MRFTVYLGTCAALLASTQAAEMKTITEVPVDIETETEAKAEVDAEVYADAVAEIEAYVQAQLQTVSEADAYIQSLTTYEEMLNAQSMSTTEAEGKGADDTQNLGQVSGVEAAENIAKNFFNKFFTTSFDDVNKFYSSINNKFDSFGADTKMHFAKMIADGRNMRVSAISKLLTQKITGFNAF